jgi:outer membrane lipoprotein carrier protein
VKKVRVSVVCGRGTVEPRFVLAQRARSEGARWMRAVKRNPTIPLMVPVVESNTRSEDHPNRPSRHYYTILLFVIALTFLPINLIVSTSHTADEGKEISKEQKDVLEVVKKLQGRYEQTKDLQAEFQQTTRIEGFATPLTSSGRMSIKKPGLLRWDYREPTVEEIYVTRNDVMMYVPEHKQVLVGKLTQMAASQAPLQLLQGVAKIDEEFEIESTRGDERGEGGLPLITLTPKSTEPDASRSVSKLVLEVQPKTYFIKAVTIHEVSGNISTFVFSNLKPNTGLKSGVFEFKVPAGVEVVKAPTLSPP